MSLFYSGYLRRVQTNHPVTTPNFRNRSPRGHKIPACSGDSDRVSMGVQSCGVPEKKLPHHSTPGTVTSTPIPPSSRRRPRTERPGYFASLIQIETSPPGNRVFVEENIEKMSVSCPRKLSSSSLNQPGCIELPINDLVPSSSFGLISATGETTQALMGDDTPNLDLAPIELAPDVDLLISVDTDGLDTSRSAFTSSPLTIAVMADKVQSEHDHILNLGSKPSVNVSLDLGLHSSAASGVLGGEEELTGSLLIASSGEGLDIADPPECEKTLSDAEGYEDDSFEGSKGDGEGISTSSVGAVDANIKHSTLTEDKDESNLVFRADVNQSLDLSLFGGEEEHADTLALIPINQDSYGADTLESEKSDAEGYEDDSFEDNKEVEDDNT